MKIVAVAWEVREGGAMFDIDWPTVHRMDQLSGPSLFAVRFRGKCLNSNSKWELEPMPSSRDEDFMRRCRFNSFEDAVQTLERLL